MALANVAWILAAAGRSVLIIDWDLEAPGLHRYFRPFLIDDELSATKGLMDLVDDYATQAIRPVDANSKPDPNWYLEYADFTDYIVSINFDRFPSGGKIDLLPAGQQNDHYAVLVSSFAWQNFYDRLGGGGFFEAVKAQARAKYSYVLIDSRTGVSDTAGICSVQMPDSLVACFTYNNQSIKGAAAVVRSAIERRAALEVATRAARRVASADATELSIADTPAPYRIFPVPMRVESGESERLAIRQNFARQCFDEFIEHIRPSEVGEYWGSVEIPHKAFYAYEEVLAPFKDDAMDPKTVLAAFVRLTQHISDDDVSSFKMSLSPDETQTYLNKFAQTTKTPIKSEARQESEEETLARAAEATLASLNESDRVKVRRIFGRLVRLTRAEEGGDYYPIRAAVKDFSVDEAGVLHELVTRGLITISSESPRNARRSQASSSATEQTVGLADERLLTGWRTLLEWLEIDQEFLIWRQQLKAYLSDWERTGRSTSALLSGPILREAEHWLLKQKADLNAAESAYIAESTVFEASVQSARTSGIAEIRPSAVAVAAKADVRASRSWSIGQLSVGLLLIVSITVGALVLRSCSPSRKMDRVTPSNNTQSTSDEPNVEKLVAQGDGYFVAGNASMARKAYAEALSKDPTNSAASSGLNRVNEEDSSTPGWVVLQYVNQADSDTVEKVEAILDENLKPLSLPSPELVPGGKTSGDVRYFFPTDEKLALRAKRATEFALANVGIRLTLTVLARDAKKFPYATSGAVEVWLPSLRSKSVSGKALRSTDSSTASYKLPAAITPLARLVTDDNVSRYQPRTWIPPKHTTGFVDLPRQR
jgi:MinD-like ATPase involved in chromosome partitioning or flagellar assembly